MIPGIRLATRLRNAVGRIERYEVTKSQLETTNANCFSYYSTGGAFIVNKLKKLKTSTLLFKRERHICFLRTFSFFSFFNQMCSFCVPQFVCVKKTDSNFNTAVWLRKVNGILSQYLRVASVRESESYKGVQPTSSRARSGLA